LAVSVVLPGEVCKVEGFKGVSRLVSDGKRLPLGGLELDFA